MLALEHALARPGAVRSLVLSSTLASADEWVVEVKRLRDAIEGDDDEVLDEFERRHFFRGESEPLELVRMREERSSAVYEAMWGRNEWTMTGALAGWDVRPRLAELRMPTLILRGAHDLSTDAIAKTLTDGHPARARGRLRGELPHARSSRRRSATSAPSATSSTTSKPAESTAGSEATLQGSWRGSGSAPADPDPDCALKGAGGRIRTFVG